ncbi:hypothetical protein AGLY_013500 [Aphis glycines]|uniref:Uncharacterized protein n=1 Tax=Aphis glycines TaxID=307491 RepID=A0A6G0T7T1_APHGL|nr:hypothetical protein AGLY_013500 [Aphis glycines]
MDMPKLNSNNLNSTHLNKPNNLPKLLTESLKRLKQDLESISIISHYNNSVIMNEYYEDNTFPFFSLYLSVIFHFLKEILNTLLPLPNLLFMLTYTTSFGNSLLIVGIVWNFLKLVAFTVKYNKIINKKDYIFNFIYLFVFYGFQKKLISCYNVYQLSIALLFNTDVIIMYNKQKLSMYCIFRLYLKLGYKISNIDIRVIEVPIYYIFKLFITPTNFYNFVFSLRYLPEHISVKIQINNMFIPKNVHYQYSLKTLDVLLSKNVKNCYTVKKTVQTLTNCIIN